MIVIATITSTELSTVILMPMSLFKERILSVTTAIDKPKERATLSRAFICLKKTSVQAKPGRKNINMNPRIALMIGKGSRKGKANPRTSLTEDSQSTPYISSPGLLPRRALT